MNYKFKLSKTSLLILFALIALTSCQEQVEQLKKSKPDVWVEDQTIHFKNEEAFKNTMDNLHGMTPEEKDDWLVKMNFENSLYQKTEYLDTTSKSSYLDVPDPVFSTVLNADGIYVLGNKIHKVTMEHELATDLKTHTNFEKIDWENNGNIQKRKIRYGKADYIYEKLNKPSHNGRKDTRKYEPYNGDFYRNGSKYDIDVTHLSAHIVAWNRSYWNYASAGLKIKGRKYKSGGFFGTKKWRDDPMHYAKIDYEGRAKYCYPGNCTSWFTRTGSKSGENEKNVQKTIFYYVGVGGWIDADYFDADFTYEDDGYPKVYRNNEYFDF